MESFYAAGLVAVWPLNPAHGSTEQVQAGAETYTVALAAMDETLTDPVGNTIGAYNLTSNTAQDFFRVRECFNTKIYLSLRSMCICFVMKMSFLPS